MWCRHHLVSAGAGVVESRHHSRESTTWRRLPWHEQLTVPELLVAEGCRARAAHCPPVEVPLQRAQQRAAWARHPSTTGSGQWDVSD